MGRREFYAWVDQAHRELAAGRETPDQWGDRQDPWWQQAHQKARSGQY